MKKDIEPIRAKGLIVFVHCVAVVQGNAYTYVVSLRGLFRDMPLDLLKHLGTMI